MNNKLYNQLNQKFTDEEIAESYIFPHELSKEEEEQDRKEMKALRAKMLREQSQEKKMYVDLIRLKLLIEDYITQEDYNIEQSFGAYLEEYIRIIQKTKKAFAQDIDTHYTRLSRILNNREEPNLEIIYRLEEHSGKIIPALLWWKLQIKKQEYLILKDTENRIKEAKKVKNKFKISA